MRAYERLLRYIHFETASDESAETCPSTPSQKVLGQALVDELKEMGIDDARMDSWGFVYASIPANTPGYPVIGLLAHMDTSPDAAAGPMKERIIENYDGGDIRLENGCVMAVSDYPALAQHKGKHLIVTDGNTLLGADDKAGVAEIMTLCEQVMKKGNELPHGKLSIVFTPDEEIGTGILHADLKEIGADFAYTMDGGAIGGIEFETFNASTAKLTFHGISSHPGSAKNHMVNACQLLMDFHALLPCAERPEFTEGRDGFFHMVGMQGTCERAECAYIIRDFDRSIFERRKSQIRAAADYLNQMHGYECVTVEITDSYSNMYDVLKEHPDIIARAENACRAVGIPFFHNPIRGGTDGARLSFQGLPCPDLGTGGMNYHSVRECIAVEDMDLAVSMLEALVSIRS